MTQNKFKGLGIALITPFKTDGEVDYDALTRLVEYQIQNGIDFLCIMGTTAETPCLSADEKKTLKRLLVERVAGRVPLLMGCGGNNTAAVIQDLNDNDWSGIDGSRSVCAY
ncbi:MAG: dihydrodipicolinate synthase family protein, partial [Paraprevotella sp.]|nr:dihydrodipicolinate synthase family protein [Paraprevotella sp.]